MSVVRFVHTHARDDAHARTRKRTRTCTHKHKHTKTHTHHILVGGRGILVLTAILLPTALCFLLLSFCLHRKKKRRRLWWRGWRGFAGWSKCPTCVQCAALKRDLKWEYDLGKWSFTRVRISFPASRVYIAEEENANRVVQKHRQPAIFSVYSTLQRQLHVAITLVLFRWLAVSINREMVISSSAM